MKLIPLQLNNGLMQLTFIIIIAFINFLCLNFNLNWIFGVQVSPIFATILSFIFLRKIIPVAILGYALQEAGLQIPLFPIN